MIPSTETQDQTRRAFDEAASWYDELHATDGAFRAAREFTQEIYLSHFHPGSRLLELNCGTGLDAVFLSRRGFRIVATDLSAAMIAQVEKKRALDRLHGSLEARQLGFADLIALDGESFDGAYSNFGGLNCTDRLSDLAATLARLLRPGSYFIATVMPDFCLWESLSMLLRLRVAGAIRRSHGSGIGANLGGVTFPTYYYSPRKFLGHFREHFSPVNLFGLNILTPPLNHLRAYRFLRPLLPILYRIDHGVASLPGFRRIGDHFVAVLQRNVS